jgi:hypothetical protein
MVAVAEEEEVAEEVCVAVAVEVMVAVEVVVPVAVAVVFAQPCAWALAAVKNLTRDFNAVNFPLQGTL